MNPIAVIGAGPSGLAGARALARAGLPFVVFEAADDVGGLWNIDNPRSTVYESAHLISSRTTTEFAEFPMDSATDYPGHRELHRYFREFADAFGLREHVRFGRRVTRVEPVGGDESGASGWLLTSEPVAGGAANAGASDDAGPETSVFSAVILANGTLAEPNVPAFAGEFTGELLHSNRYKRASQFDGKRVLIIGAGNSGCDIAVDAVHHAASVDLSVRRGYYFVPRYVFGKPTDTLNQGRPLPAPLKQFIDTRLLRAFTGDPAKFGFPVPDYKIYESHPIVNTLVLNHLGQGDLRVMGDVERFDGETVHFAAVRDAPEQAAAFRARADAPWPDLTGGYHYLGLDRMSYYVNKDAYRRTVKKLARTLPAVPETAPAPGAAAAASVVSAPPAASHPTVSPEGTRA